jgi:hypothetical protein
VQQQKKIKCKSEKLMEFVKSKFSNDTIYNGLLMLIIPLPIGIIFTYRILYKFYNNGIDDLGEALISAFVILIFIFLLYYLKLIRYLIIKEDTLTYYSLLRPFGKTLNFNDYIGKIETKEKGKFGSYNVIYLVDKDNRTCFKIMGLHYKKFGTIYNAIPLKKIDFYPNTAQYLKLLFGGNITVRNIEKTDTERKLKKIFNYFVITIYLGLGVLFLLVLIVMIRNIFS